MERPALEQLASGRVLFSYLLVRQPEDFILHRLGHHHDSVEVRKDQFAGMDEDFPAADGHIVGHHPAAALAIQWANALIEDREPHLNNPAAVADHAVTNAPNGSIALGHGAHQFA